MTACPFDAKPPTAIAPAVSHEYIIGFHHVNVASSHLVNQESC